MSALTAERIREVLDYCPEAGVFIWKPRLLGEFSSARFCRTWNSKYAGKEAGAIDKNGYRRIWLDGRLYRAHRLAWMVCHGDWPAKFIDHINGNRLDNRIINLRDATKSDNCRNTAIPKSNKSGVLGVSWRERDKRWIAQIRHGEKVIHLGSFTDFDAAVICRKSAEQLYGYHENHGRKPAGVDAA